jgi:uncharacterized surface protein with fasciclin (FAS1) repeats
MTTISRPSTIAESLRDSSSFTTFWALLAESELEDTLHAPGAFVVFAPTQAAFRELPPEILDRLREDPAWRRDLLAHHVVAASACGATFTRTTMRTLHGTLLEVDVTDDGLAVGHAHTWRGPIRCLNGVIHAIDAVLVPGFVRPKSRAANGRSAWSGVRAPRPAADPNPDWPFVQPPG